MIFWGLFNPYGLAGGFFYFIFCWYCPMYYFACTQRFRYRSLKNPVSCMRKLAILLALCTCTVFTSLAQNSADTTITDTAKLFTIRDLQRLQRLVIEYPYETAPQTARAVLLAKLQELLDEKIRAAEALRRRQKAKQ